ncbi:unnamed protein product, partial [Arabidopsis halleri]
MSLFDLVYVVKAIELMRKFFSFLDKDQGAAVWRRSSEIECMEDAFGTSIAWPEDKVV